MFLLVLLRAKVAAVSQGKVSRCWRILVSTQEVLPAYLEPDREGLPSLCLFHHTPCVLRLNLARLVGCLWQEKWKV